MTKRTPVRVSLRTILLGSAALGFATALSLPAWDGAGGLGIAYAQNQTTHGQGAGRQGGSEAGHASSGGGGSSTTHGVGMGGGHDATAPSNADSGGSGVAGGSDASGTSGASGGSDQAAGHGHFGQGGSTGAVTSDEGTSTDKKGPRFGGGENTRKPGEGTSGGRPAWAKEGIPEVELGRLSVARAPASVLQHAYTEVTTNWTTTGGTVMTLTAAGHPTLTMTVAQLYSLPADQFARIVQTYYDSIVRIDSPLENLSLLKDVRTNDKTVLTGVTPASTMDLAAIFLGSASDKTLPVTVDTVTAINTILGLPALSAADTAALAAQADAVRLAISTGHGA